MLFFHHHPRFALLLSSLLITTLLLLLQHAPRPASQPSSTSRRRPLKPPAGFEGLAARVRRAERAYQKMLRGRDALIAKVGPAPHNVALFPPDKEPWPPYTVCEFPPRHSPERLPDSRSGDFFPPAFFCPHELERVGELGDGGKWVCGLSRLQENEDCVVYSVGPLADASFEAELLARTRHCQLFVFDPTVSSLPRRLSAHATLPPGLDEFYASLDALNNDEEFDYWDSRHTPQRTHFKPYHVAGSDAPRTGDTPRTYTLESLMRLNGHTHIDILKIDLEGWEFDALTAFLIPSSNFTAENPRVPPVSQMLIELHLWNREFSDFLNWWKTLERAGLRAVAREPNLVYQNYNRMQGAELAEYTLLNVAKPNVFISDGVPTRPPSSAPLPASPPDPAELLLASVRDEEQVG